MPCTWPLARSVWTRSRMKSRTSSFAVAAGIGFLSSMFLSTSTPARIRAFGGQANCSTAGELGSGGLPAECSSQRGHSAVHEQQGASDVGGIVGGQEQDGSGDLLGPTRTLQHGASCRLGVVLLDSLAGRRDAALAARRADRTRTDGVASDVLRPVVGRA